MVVLATKESSHADMVFRFTETRVGGLYSIPVVNLPPDMVAKNIANIAVDITTYWQQQIQLFSNYLLTLDVHLCEHCGNYCKTLALRMDCE